MNDVIYPAEFSGIRPAAHNAPDLSEAIRALSDAIRFYRVIQRCNSSTMLMQSRGGTGCNLYD